MSAEVLLEQFRRVTEAPDAIQRMRSLVLDLAVRGRLVPQNDSDEPAASPFSPREAGGERCGVRGDCTESRLRLPEGYRLPAGWEWAKLGDIATIERGGSPRPIKAFLTDDPSGLNWIKIGDTDKGQKYITATKERIRRDGLTKTRMVHPGDFLLTNSMSFGRPYITQIQGCIHDGWLRISPPETLAKDYLYYLLSSPLIRRLLEASAAGAVVQNLNVDKVKELPIPIPPLVEQQRIAGKVDELMALCDELETVQAQREASRDRLARSVLHHLAPPAEEMVTTPPETLHRSAAKAIECFDDIMVRPEHVEMLRSSIRRLAVTGRLSTQNPSERPVDIQGAEGAIVENAPRGWRRARFEDVFSLEYGKNLPAEKRSNTGEYPVYGSNGVVGSHSEASVHAACIVIGRKGSAGALRLSTSPGCWVTDVAYYCIPPDFIELEYAYLVFQTLELASLGKGVKPGLTRRDAADLAILIPPRDEQQRIVEEVERLQMLCNQLLEGLECSRRTRQALLESVIAAAV